MERMGRTSFDASTSTRKSVMCTRTEGTADPKQTDTIYTGGEDGFVKAWKVEDETNSAVSQARPARIKDKKDDKGKGRLFKPY